MNKPEHIIVDEFGLIVAAVKAALSLPNLNYLYGYASEMNETLMQWSKNATDASKKYPLVWLAQPFTITKGHEAEGFYGLTTLKWFVINESGKDLKSDKRMTNNFKSIIYPIKREMIAQLELSEVFASTTSGSEYEYNETDRYYWGIEQEKILKDIFDCLEVSNFKTFIYNQIN
jgi:hypothetical protein